MVLMKGKLIVVEGTDCSGKETQVKKTIKSLTDAGLKVTNFSFPMYDTPTGKIVGGPYLGKEEISPCWFSEGATHVDALTASLLYAADRRYNIAKINEYLKKGYIVILDRYVYSNMAHQGSKIDNKGKRIAMYKKLDKLEFDVLELPRADMIIFLYMPLEYANKLKKKRKALDEHEKDSTYLKKCEVAYLELSDIYDYVKINCVENNEIRSIDDINKEVVTYIREVL